MKEVVDGVLTIKAKVMFVPISALFYCLCILQSVIRSIEVPISENSYFYKSFNMELSPTLLLEFGY